MKSEKMFDGITHIKDETIEEARSHKFRKKRKYWPAAVAAVLVIAVAAGSLLPGRTVITASVDSLLSVSPNTAHAISEAVYPQTLAYPDIFSYAKDSSGNIDDEAYLSDLNKWYDAQAARLEHEEYSDGLTQFLTRSAQAVLGNSTEKNPVYSPISTYLALGMLAELTDGTSRQQILTALGEVDLEGLRKQANTLWNANYSNDGVLTTVLASSLWLDDRITYNADTMDILTDNYYASSYWGEMGSKELNELLQAWLNDQTGGMLQEQVANQTLSPETVLALATTVYFKGKWVDQFVENQTAQDLFHAPDGDVTADFMHDKSDNTYYWADQFGAVGLEMANGAAMWLLLPDEGVTPEALLEDPQTMEFILAGTAWENAKRITVDLSLPKFDVVSETDLTDGLNALGITDVFNSETADFSPTTKDAGNIYLSEATHTARVTVDEEGCTASAITVMEAALEAIPPDDEIDFTLDRPFVFAITSPDQMPLFVGVVNEP